jgi:hypothetical protein
MPKAIAIAIPQNALAAAASSLKNCLKLSYGFMYGTTERTNATLWFALGLAVLGGVMGNVPLLLPQVCPL